MSRAERLICEDAVGIASRLFGVTPREIKGKSRRREIVRARQALCLVLNSRGYSDDAIASFLSCDRVTARYSREVLHKLLYPAATSPSGQQVQEQLRKRLGEISSIWDTDKPLDVTQTEELNRVLRYANSLVESLEVLVSQLLEKIKQAESR